MNENLENLKQKAQQLFDDKNWDELIPICTEIIELEKSSRVKALAYFRRGFAYVEKGNSSQAITDFTKTLELNPDSAAAYFYRGQTYDKKDDLDLAIADFTKALELDPDSAAAYFFRGRTYNKKDDLDLAIADFTKTLELNPDSPNSAWIYFFRGFVYMRKKDYAQTISDSNKALELEPPSTVRAVVHFLRGVVYQREGNFLNAFNHFVDSNKYDPNLKSIFPQNYVASQIADIYKGSKKEGKAKAFELYSNLLNSIIKIQRKQFYKPEEGREVAHYTSLHTLKDLANKEEHFRFYNAAYMNDPEEGSVFFDIIEEVGTDVKKDFYGEGEDLSYQSPAYIGSFIMVDSNSQEQRDKLFLWRTYGKHNGQEAAGVCLIFRHEGTCFAKIHELQVGSMQQLQSELPIVAGDFENPGERQHPKPALYKILYMDKGNNKELSKELNELVKSLKQVECHLPKRKRNRRNRLKRLTRELLDNIRFLFKASHYKEEREVRVIQLCYYDENMSQEPDGIKVDTEQIPPRFYLDAHKSFRFDEVILGPEAHGVREWTQWLKKRGIKAKKSEIKYGKQSF